MVTVLWNEVILPVPGQARSCPSCLWAGGAGGHPQWLASPGQPGKGQGSAAWVPQAALATDRSLSRIQRQGKKKVTHSGMMDPGEQVLV